MPTKEIKKSDLLRALLRAVSRTYYAEIVRKTPGKGHVADGWDIDIIGDTITIYNSEFGDIVNFLENGTKKHIIRAKNKKFLKFKKPDGPRKRNPNPIKGNVAFEKDGYIYTKAVRHPGIKARLFIQNILSDNSIAKKFELELEKELNKYI